MEVAVNRNPNNEKSQANIMWCEVFERSNVNLLSPEIQNRKPIDLMHKPCPNRVFLAYNKEILLCLPPLPTT